MSQKPRIMRSINDAEYSIVDTTSRPSKLTKFMEKSRKRFSDTAKSNKKSVSTHKITSYDLGEVDPSSKHTILDNLSDNLENIVHNKSPFFATRFAHQSTLKMNTLSGTNDNRFTYSAIGSGAGAGLTEYLLDPTFFTPVFLGIIGASVGAAVIVPWDEKRKRRIKNTYDKGVAFLASVLEASEKSLGRKITAFKVLDLSRLCLEDLPYGMKRSSRANYITHSYLVETSDKRYSLILLTQTHVYDMENAEDDTIFDLDQKPQHYDMMIMSIESTNKNVNDYGLVEWDKKIEQAEMMMLEMSALKEQA